MLGYLCLLPPPRQPSLLLLLKGMPHPPDTAPLTPDLLFGTPHPP